LWLFKKQEGCLPTIDELLAIVTDMADCPPRRAFARLRRAILDDEAIVRWDDDEQDFLLDFGPRAVTESTPDWFRSLMEASS